MYIIKGGTVHIGDKRVEQDCDVLIRGRVIEAVGKNLSRRDAEIIDGRGRHIFPGFIDPTSAIGAMGIPTSYPDINEKSSPVVPEMNIRYAMDPDELDNQEFYKSGITAVALAPGNANVIGGQMAVFKTAPMKLSERLVKEKAGLKGAVTADVLQSYGKRDMMPMTRMGIFHLMDKAIKDALAAEEKDKTQGQRVLSSVMEGKLPFFVSADLKGEIDSLLHLFQGTKARIHLVDGFSFGGCVNQMISQGTGLVLGNVSDLSQITRHGMDLSLIKKLTEAGNPVALTNSHNGSSEGREVLLWSGIELYRAGLDPEEVIKMMSLNPARMLGVDDRLGTIEPGKDADISIFTAHPITTYAAKVEHSFVSGKVVF